MTYTEPERRRHPRISGRFILSYRVLSEKDNVETTQTKNLSLGGMLLTTNKSFAPGTTMAIELRLPFDPDPIMLIAKVVESCEIAKDLIYDTRLSFISIDERHRKVISGTVDYYLKKG